MTAESGARLPDLELGQPTTEGERGRGGEEAGSGTISPSKSLVATDFYTAAGTR